MKNHYLGSIVLVILLCIGFTNAYAEGKVGVITGGIKYTMPSWFKSSFLELADDVDEAKESNKHVLLFFHLDECPYCEHMVKDFDKLFLKKFMQQNFDVIAINMRGGKEVAVNEDESLSEKQFSEKVGVQYTPTIIFLNQKNETVARTNGYRKPEKFKKILEYVSSKAYQNLTLSEYIEATKKVGNYQLQQHSMYQNISDFSTIKTPLAIIFEDKNCAACTYFYSTTLKDKTIASAFNAFKVVRFDADSTQTIVDNKGNQTTPKDWVQRLKLNYRPGIILLNGGNEITRIDGFLYNFHFQEVLRFVSGHFYQKFATYNAYLAYRQKQLLEQGISINIRK